MENIIVAEGLRKEYDGFALEDVSFRVPGGAIMGLIGENGAGKTTTIKCLLNLVRRDAGTVTLLGMDDLEGEKEIKQDVGVVLDECFFHDSLRAKDVGVILAPVYRGWDEELYRRYLKKYKLPEKIYQGILPGHENEAVPGGGPGPPTPAADPGRGYRGAGPGGAG